MTVIYGLIGLSFIVFIHELGHFIAARICGVTVESFSIGMGPVLPVANPFRRLLRYER